MDRFIEVDKRNIKELIKTNKILVCKLRNSRIKAKQIGIMEMLMLNYDLNVLFIKNGPLGDVKGIVSFLVSNKLFDLVLDRLKYVGYFNVFYILNFDNKQKNNTNIKTINPLNFKGLSYSLKTILIQDEKLYEKDSSHNRSFKIISFDKEKEVIGYRGTGKDLGRRALPVSDARCMVNLSIPFIRENVVDPFAGAGGIVYMLKKIKPSINITSIDIDKTLEPGLVYYGAKHITSDASEVTLEEKFDAIITEVPFNKSSTNKILNSFKNIYKYLNEKGIIVLMCGIDQFDEIGALFNRDLNINLLFFKKLNRKGTNVVIGIWTKDINLKKELNYAIEIINKVH